MRNIKLKIEYEGTNYCGWQTQLNLPTVQQTIEESLCKITSENIKIFGSGRTDSGVHACEQVANFKTSTELSSRQILKALNSILPADIAITEVEEADIDFHSQYSCSSKIYEYLILNRESPSALLRNRVWFIQRKLKISSMKEASLLLIGEHDFSAFAKSDLTVKTTVRTIKKVNLKKNRAGLIKFEIEANGFLKRMVRLIVGTLVEVGKGKISPAQFGDILKNGIKTQHVVSAPPHGLYLKKVLYERGDK